MELIECETCGAHSFTNGKCDYCGNQYEIEQEYQDLYDDDKYARRVYGTDGISDYEPLFFQETDEASDAENFNGLGVTEITFNHGNKRGDKVLAFMLYLLLSIIWFAVTIFIPPLFLITITVLIILAVIKIIKKIKFNA